ncbi:TIGR03663 family protein [Abditibacterium utsteinense]|uniref:TIGR03663 family protein n=1 Tax=Abditibacterium utsteinense TaxID=1960156 RepID=A0A2S8SUG3_9BACT|nr:flippase activity-associated protein Agl23 [Abditibacterium utsteinense]PQV64426.1 TIGR03663 family protein [Abditibacterium utsteinense]
MESQKTTLSNRFWLGASLTLIIGIALRQFRLGEASFHPDEAIHTFFAGGFNTYHYDPVYHGPLLYHLVAWAFGLAGGQNDFSARLIPSLFGIGLLAFIIGPMREWLGNRGALSGAALLAISPSMVTYSRRLLHDSLALFLTIGAVFCFLNALEHGANTARGRNSRIGVAAFLTLFLATKANCFFIAAMLGAFYVFWRLAGFIKIPRTISQWIPALLFLIICAASIIFPRDNTFDEALKATQHRTFQIVAVLSCLFFGLWLLTRQTGESETQSKRNWWFSSDATTYFLALAAALWLYVFFFGQGAQILIQWGQTRHFPQQAFLDGAQHARGAIPKMLEYWGGQQKVPRLPGRHDYYLVLALLYEIPVLLAAMGGIWHASKNRSVCTDLLLWWAFTSWTIYAVANEKVPWLLVHSILPLALLGGVWLGTLGWRKPALQFAAALGVLISLRGVSGANFERAGDNIEPILYAQTPEAFRDVLNQTLRETHGDDRPVWMANDQVSGDRQWPSVWYLRPGAPEMGASNSIIGGAITPDQFRVAISNEPQWLDFANAGWAGRTVDFLIWPRASWAAIAPNRYMRWFWTRDTLPKSERDLPQDQWKISILGGKGEWSHATAVIGKPPK